MLREKLAQGQQALVLVPEISLTPQLIRRFSERFGDEIAVIHSHLTEREKTNQWWSIVDGKKKILIGARSALFCPFPNLGMIVVDEEHESSFKQDEKLKYNARDCAIMLGKTLNIPVVLGSATPSLESWQNANEGKYKLHILDERISAGKLPEIEVVDMRKEEKSDLPSWLSRRLHEKIQERLNDREQVALFLNRRGFSQVIMCRECGHIDGCPNCDVTLSLHAKSHLICHYCGYHEDLLKTCKECKMGEPKPLGIGTEKIEEEIKNLFPKARTIRLDRDEISSRESLEDAIQKIETGAVDVLIGTQMIAKGLDFPKLTLVGVLLADIGFNFPDFRSPERNFQLLTQVSGRPGRHTHNGEVIIQTYDPEYSSLVYSQKNDYSGFAKNELGHRKELSYPPFGKVASVRIQSNDPRKLKKYCDQFADLATQIQKKHKTWASSHLQVLGPAQAPIFKLKNKYRYHVLLKASQQQIIREFYRILAAHLEPPSGVQVTIDVDPQNTF
jgi:primosomal protein N' (replication factor Y)